MSQSPSHRDTTVLSAAQPLAGAGAGPADSAVTLPRLVPAIPRPRLAWPRSLTTPLAARAALGTILVSVALVVLFSSAQQNILVPRAYLSFPNWEAGPLHHLFGTLPNHWTALVIGFSAILLVVFAAYCVVLASARTLSMRTVVICVLALHVLLLMGPPLQLSDLFNYLGYSRLFGVHHLNPYLHTMVGEAHDPVFRFSSWHRLRSPYGPLFTAITLPFAFTSVATAYWLLKVLTVTMSLAFVGLVWLCARRLGRDPRLAVAFVAFNPVFLFYEVAGFHNDPFMLLPSMAAVAFLLYGRDRSAGAAVMIAVAVKFTAILLLPFLLLGARSRRRRVQILLGAVIGAVPLVAMSLLLFGFTIPNLQDQSTLLTIFSVPNVLGWVLGFGGGAPILLKAVDVALVIVILLQLRRQRDWLHGAGWSTLALVASLAWLVPWYVIWAAPLAALGTSVRLRRATIAFSAYVLIAFAPATGYILNSTGVNLFGSQVSQASRALEQKLSS